MGGGREKEDEAKEAYPSWQWSLAWRLAPKPTCFTATRPRCIQQQAGPRLYSSYYYYLRPRAALIMVVNNPNILISQYDGVRMTWPGKGKEGQRKQGICLSIKAEQSQPTFICTLHGRVPVAPRSQSSRATVPCLSRVAMPTCPCRRPRRRESAKAQIVWLIRNHVSRATKYPLYPLCQMTFGIALPLEPRHRLVPVYRLHCGNLDKVDVGGFCWPHWLILPTELPILIVTALSLSLACR